MTITVIINMQNCGHFVASECFVIRTYIFSVCMWSAGQWFKLCGAFLLLFSVWCYCIYICAYLPICNNLPCTFYFFCKLGAWQLVRNSPLKPTWYFISWDEATELFCLTIMIVNFVSSNFRGFHGSSYPKFYIHSAN